MYRAANDVWVYPERGLIRLQTTDKTKVKALQQLPEAGVRWRDSQATILLPYTDAMCRAAQGQGFNMLFATPFWSAVKPKVEGKYDAMRHQLITSAFIVLNPRCFVLSDCRLGKTGSAILALDYLQRTQAFCGGILVITTVTTMRSVWQLSVTATLPEASVHVVHGAKRDEALQIPADWFITNYDSVRLHVGDFMAAAKDGRIGCVLIDELTHAGNAQSQRHKAMYALTNQTPLKYVIGMTGSPGCKPDPVYGMVRAVNPVSMPYHTFTSWIANTTFQYGPQPFMRKPTSNCADVIHSVLQPSIRFRKEDVLDLPPIVFQNRDCAISKEQTRLLNEFRDEAVAFVSSGEPVTAANSAVLMNKLLQVPLGFLMHEGKLTELAHDKRDQVILDIIAESSRKVVIFCMFKHRLAVLEQVLTKAGVAAARIDGSVTGEKRVKILTDFSCAENPRVLVCHPTTVGFGTELSAADTMVIDGPPVLGDFSYTQMLERLSSVKQQASKISIIKVFATSEEMLLFSRLADGQTAGRAVASLFETFAN